LNNRSPSALLFVLLLACSFSAGQDAPTGTANNLNVNYTIPDSPAFTLLGVNPDKIERPATPRDLAVSLLNGLDENGHFQSGLALDLNPYMMLRGKATTITQYENNLAVRWLANSQLSVGTTKGSSAGDESTKLGLGLHTLLWNRKDSRLDKKLVDAFKAAATNALMHIPETCGAIPAGDTVGVAKCQAKLLQAVQDAIAPRKKELEENYWNSSYLAVAGALALVSQTGSLDSMNWNGAGAWTTLAYGFEDAADTNFFRKHAQLSFHAEWRNNETVTDPNDSSQTFIRSSELGGTRLLIGTASSNGSFEMVFRHSHPKDPARQDENYARITAGVEHKLSDQVWLNFSVASDAGRGQGKDKLVVSTNFKWGTSNNAKIKP